MRISVLHLLFAITAATAFSTPPRAQASDAARAVEVTVSYNMSVPLKSDDPEVQKDAMEKGRRMLYEMAGNECTNLTATIADTCELARLNVQVNALRGSRAQEFASATENASYRIRLKQAK